MRKKLLEGDLLDISLKVRREDDHILFPVTSERRPDLGYELVEEDFEERELAETDYKDMVRGPGGSAGRCCPPPSTSSGTSPSSSFRTSCCLMQRGSARRCRKAFPRLRTVALDKGVKGELRVRDLEVIAGGPGTETTHLEYGIKLLVDPAKVYFNPRLANERSRIASLVRQGEVGGGHVRRRRSVRHHDRPARLPQPGLRRRPESGCGRVPEAEHRAEQG